MIFPLLGRLRYSSREDHIYPTPDIEYESGSKGDWHLIISLRRVGCTAYRVSISAFRTL